MAEMTASEAVEMSKHEVSTFVKRRGEIAALIQQQQQQIEAQAKRLEAAEKVCEAIAKPNSSFWSGVMDAFRAWEKVKEEQ